MYLSLTKFYNHFIMVQQKIQRNNLNSVLWTIKQKSEKVTIHRLMSRSHTNWNIGLKDLK